MSLLFSFPPYGKDAHRYLTQKEWQEESTKMIRAFIPQFGEACAKTDPEIPLPPHLSISAAVIAYKYFGFPLRESAEHPQGIRMCGGEKEGQSCRNDTCWCRNNVMLLAPLPEAARGGVAGCSYYYGFVNRNRAGTEEVHSKAPCKVLTVDAADTVHRNRGYIVRKPKAI